MDLLTPPEPDKKEDAPATPGIVIPAAPSAPAQTGAGHVDLDKILLPKKEVPGQTPLSAQRVNAGALMEQENAAATLGTHANDTPAQMAAAVKPPAEPAPQAPESEVKQLETFQRDIESVVQGENLSVLSIATAEAERRAGAALPGESADSAQAQLWTVRNIVLIAGGVLFLIAASGALAYLVTRPTSVPVVATASPSTPYITVDAVKDITITQAEQRSDVMNSLNAARQATSLSLGLMSQLLVTESSSTPGGDVLTVIQAQDFFTLIAPHIPSALARTFLPAYLLGVHEYNGEQPFIILKVDSYEAAYSGMLAWEPYLAQDLLPLFNYTPTQHIPEQNIATTTPSPASQFIQTGFVDKIVENHDARALVNSTGDIYLLWTFIDRNTLVIATNDATLREIISRLKEAPITPIPGQ
jgi:hypothetical protein